MDSSVNAILSGGEIQRCTLDTSIRISELRATIGSVNVTIPATTIPLTDSTTGRSDPGAYHIQARVNGETCAYFVTYGLGKPDSDTLMTIGRVIKTKDHQVVVARSSLPRILVSARATV